MPILVFVLWTSFIRPKVFIYPQLASPLSVISTNFSCSCPNDWIICMGGRIYFYTFTVYLPHHLKPSTRLQTLHLHACAAASYVTPTSIRHSRSARRGVLRRNRAVGTEPAGQSARISPLAPVCRRFICHPLHQSAIPSVLGGEFCGEIGL